MELRLAEQLNGLARCPQCNVAKPLLMMHWRKAIQTETEPPFVVHWAAYECTSCNKVTLAEGMAVKAVDARGNIALGMLDRVVRLYPGATGVDPNLPVDAQRYLKQAIETKFAPDASVLMSASAVDAMMKEKGFIKGSLYDRIDKAVAEHVLTEGMAKWAHKVRLDANAVRHADGSAGPPTADDAQRSIEFTKALGDFLFVFTARVAEGIREADTTVPSE